MELRVSSPKRAVLPSECLSDPDEKEISDADDDDRNHKHRRREARSHSVEEDALKQMLTRPYRKGNKPTENGHVYRGSDSQSSETWKKYSFSTMGKDLSAKFDKQRPSYVPFSQAPLDLDQRMRLSQPFPGDTAPIWGRGRESAHSMFNPVDIASQTIRQGAVPPYLFAGRGMPAVSTAYDTNWNAFGLEPGIPNGRIDAQRPFGLKAFNPSLSMGIQRQHCRDFEERGFCLRGDMCPMEHGVNRIVVEDVQSLSQFNLPVSLPNAQLPAAPAGAGTRPAASGPSSSLSNIKDLQSKTSNHGESVNGTGLNGRFDDATVASGGDVYDPDQPLWGADCSESSTALLAVNSSKVEEIDSLLDVGPSCDNRVGGCEHSDNEHTPVWRRIDSLKNRSQAGEKIVSKTVSSRFNHNGKKELELNSAVDEGKQVNDGISPCAVSSLRTHSGGHNARKHSQRAQRTLFVSGIPQQNNRRESLLSHFWKFGNVVDIYVPSNSERAFVQFSKREEAEAALKAPDAVMGNRFIKLWWANRDNTPDDGGIANCGPLTYDAKAVSVPPALATANKGKDDLLSVPRYHSSSATSSSAPVPASDHNNPKHAVSGAPKPTPPLQKKLENLEALKEEIRKKQEMLDQKRNDFRRQLDKLAKQASGQKAEIANEQSAKRRKVSTVTGMEKAATSSSSGPCSVVASTGAEVTIDRTKSADSVGSHISKTNAIEDLQDSSSLKPLIHPLGPIGVSFPMNRFKLDNRPTAFEIISPLPTALANVDALKEHFSVYGDLSSVELHDSEPLDVIDGLETCNMSACIYFATRSSAEKAFLGGNCWKGRSLQFIWLKSDNSNKKLDLAEISSSKGSSDAGVQPIDEISCAVSQKAANCGDEGKKLYERGSDEEVSEPEK